MPPEQSCPTSVRVKLDLIVDELAKKSSRTRGTLLAFLKAMPIPQNMHIACKKELSSLLAKAYAPPIYKTEAAAKAAASIHARVIFGISHGEGDLAAETLEGYLESLRLHERSRGGYPPSEAIFKATQDLLSSLPPDQESVIKQRFGIYPHHRLMGSETRLASWSAIADLTGIPENELELLFAKTLRKLRHPSRCDQISDVLEWAWKFPPTSPEAHLLHLLKPGAKSQ